MDRAAATERGDRQRRPAGRDDHVAGKLGCCAPGCGRQRGSGRSGDDGRRAERLLRDPSARSSRRARKGDGLLYLQQRRHGGCAEPARSFGVERVAVVDFDVHHGNGTQSMFWSDKDLFYASSHQDQFYPYTGDVDETGLREQHRQHSASRWQLTAQSFATLTARQFCPLFIISPLICSLYRPDSTHIVMIRLASSALVEDDFRWVTEKLAGVAEGSRAEAELCRSLKAATT